MSKKYLSWLFVLLFIPQVSQASLKDKIRPTLENLIGVEWTSKILGQKEEITLPEIPIIEGSAKSVDIYSKEDPAKGKFLDPEKERRSNLNYIVELYTVTRNTRPDSESVSKWMNALSQGGTREGLYRALVLDNVYAGFENYDYPVNEKVQKFVVYFLDFFLNQQTRPDTLAKSNFYTLKRVVTEKSLEVLDEYLVQKQADNFYRWYAVFSAELAKKYPEVWTNTLRASSNRKTHLSWSQSVPLQHVKAEVIIKLHKIFNSLNQ